ncbi:MAG: acetyl-CoA carboxylase biotin carboxyl carrier protein, partial [Acidobacteria bacterium]
VKDRPVNGAPEGAVAVPLPAAVPAAPAAPTPPAPETAPAGAAVEKAPAAAEAEIHEQKAPMVGTFYRAPSPEAKPFVSVGDHVEAGQTLCIIEAMKLMNEIEAEVSGTIVDIPVENAQPVEYGEVLFRIRKDA